MAAKTGNWLRLYENLVDDPKVQKLPSDLFKGLINVWCLTKRNGGVVPGVVEVAFGLRTTEDKALKLIQQLELYGLLDREGDELKPHNWDGRQYESDSSTNRTRAFRERQKAASQNGSGNGDETLFGTVPDTEQSRTEQNTEQNRRADPVRDALLAVLDELHADAVIEHRKAIKFPLTQHAAHLLAKALGAARYPNVAADTMIERGWRGFKLEWTKGQSPRPHERDETNMRTGGVRIKER